MSAVTPAPSPAPAANRTHDRVRADSPATCSAADCAATAPTGTHARPGRRRLRLPMVAADCTARLRQPTHHDTGAPTDRAGEIGRAHVRTPVTNEHIVCSLLLEQNKTTKHY